MAPTPAHRAHQVNRPACPAPGAPDHRAHRVSRRARSKPSGPNACARGNTCAPGQQATWRAQLRAMTPTPAHRAHRVSRPAAPMPAHRVSRSATPTPAQWRHQITERAQLRAHRVSRPPGMPSSGRWPNACAPDHRACPAPGGPICTRVAMASLFFVACMQQGKIFQRCYSVAFRADSSDFYQA